MAFYDQYKKIHCVGIGGIGISGVAKFLLAKGKQVTGSDTQASEIISDLQAQGVQIFIGHSASNLAADVDLVVYTEAASADNPERQAAAERNIPQLGHFDFLGALSNDNKTICLTGTNGKSTTTAMTGLIFEAADLDPTVFVGSLVPGWPAGNVRVGQSDILIVEGDEYKQKMVKLFPATTVITNIEADHLDVYRDLDHIISTFRELAQKTTGEVIINANDANSLQLIDEAEATFGTVETADLRADNRRTEAGKQTFDLVAGSQSYGSISLRIPGEFNVLNALAAASAALSYGIAFEHIRSALEAFGGIWRRFELVGRYNGADIISDYGHHPTAIRGTLLAAKEFFPGHRIVLLFQPHQHSRTKELFHDFVRSFHEADVVILSEVYEVAGREGNGNNVSGRELAREVERHMMEFSPRLKNVVYAVDLAKAEEEIRHNVKDGDVVIIMGAGDVDKVARNLVK